MVQCSIHSKISSRHDAVLVLERVEGKEVTEVEEAWQKHEDRDAKASLAGESCKVQIWHIVCHNLVSTPPTTLYRFLPSTAEYDFDLVTSMVHRRTLFLARALFSLIERKSRRSLLVSPTEGAATHQRSFSSAVLLVAISATHEYTQLG